MNIFYEKIKNNNISLAEAFAQVLETEKVGMAKLAQPLRIALVGVAQSPSVVDVINILGIKKLFIELRIFERIEK